MTDDPVRIHARPADPVAAAVEAVEGEKAHAQALMLRERWIKISTTDRPVLLAYPPDITPAEIAELAGWMLTGMIQEQLQILREGAAIESPIFHPSGMRIR